MTNVTGIIISSNTSECEYGYCECPQKQNNKQVNYLSSFVYKQN